MRITVRQGTILIAIVAVVAAALLLGLWQGDDRDDALAAPVPRYDLNHVTEFPRRSTGGRPKAASNVQPLSGSENLQTWLVEVHSEKSNEPIEGASVEIVDPKGAVLSRSTTSGKGLCRLVTQEGSGRVLRVDHTSFVPFAMELGVAEENPLESHLSVALTVAGQVRGRIASRDGTCPDGVSVTGELYYWSTEDRRLWGDFHRAISHVEAQPDENGYFVLPGLPPKASYSLSFELPRGAYIHPANPELNVEVDGPPVELLIVNAYALKLDLIDSKTGERVAAPFGGRVEMNSDHAKQYKFIDPGFMAHPNKDAAAMKEGAMTGRSFFFFDVTGAPPVDFATGVSIEIGGYRRVSRDVLLRPLAEGEPSPTKVFLERAPDTELIRFVLPNDMYGDRDVVRAVVAEPDASGGSRFSFFRLRFSMGTSDPVALHDGKYTFRFGDWQRTNAMAVVRPGSHRIVLAGIVPGAEVVLPSPRRTTAEGLKSFLCRRIYKIGGPSGWHPLDGMWSQGTEPLVIEELPPGRFHIELLFQDEPEPISFEWTLEPSMIGREPVICRPPGD